ncbi:exopolyphosphatase/guanosine-5'-triphosphate,3'-diphosphate pyrophosphatase [Micrococcus cohnii]|uniref:Exopolyphosphatase/guanosine-5'-triphosphate, 3'-diphosphate pyrophosphatase n=1 Tax=Micrococcus cohnii TaxID=993416 RepID=A0A7W7M3N1_9MICC|nr:exopolyphosphatase/guanosine-5'-triphosphate,3'-diphosphate pyrophosphatase [Micrococcus cohnii]
MRLGVLDIGSNTVHLLLVDAQPGARPVPYADHKRSLPLIQFLDAEGAITEQGQAELVAFISEAVRVAEDAQAQDMIAFCTSAIREAVNGEQVLARVQAETKVRLEELTGEQEAAMTYFAVRRWHGWRVGSILNFDIGGGSCEIAYGQDELPVHAVSLPLGAGRLTRDWFDDDPPHPKAVKRLRKYIEGQLEAAFPSFPALTAPVEVTATSKTFRSLARITGAAPSAAGPHVQRTLRADDLHLWVNRLAAMSSTDRAELPGVSQVRAEQVLAGAMVALAAMRVFGVAELQICPWALREGLILNRIDALMLTGHLSSDGRSGVGHVNLNPDSLLPGLVREEH